MSKTKIFIIIFLLFLISLIDIKTTNAVSTWTLDGQKLSTDSIYVGEMVGVSFYVHGIGLSGKTKDCVDVDIKVDGDSFFNSKCCNEIVAADEIWSVSFSTEKICYFSPSIRFQTKGTYDLVINISNGIMYPLQVSVVDFPVIKPPVDNGNGNTGNGGSSWNPFKFKTIVEIAENITTIIFWIATSIAAIMIVIGGLLLTTSAGDPAKALKGRNTVIYAIAGFAIMSLAKGIIALIQAMLGVGEQ